MKTKNEMVIFMNICICVYNMSISQSICCISKNYCKTSPKMEKLKYSKQQYMSWVYYPPIFGNQFSYSTKGFT